MRQFISREILGMSVKLSFPQDRCLNTCADNTRILQNFIGAKSWCWLPSKYKILIFHEICYVKTCTQMYIFQNKRNGTPNLEIGERVKNYLIFVLCIKKQSIFLLFYVEIVSFHFSNHTFYSTACFLRDITNDIWTILASLRHTNWKSN